MERARRAAVKLLYNGKDVTADIGCDVESLTYEDSAADESDSLQVSVNATDGKWLGSWMPDKGVTLAAVISVSDWQEAGDSAALETGVMVLDEMQYSDAPNILSLGAAAKPNNKDFSEEEREYVWKNTSIRQITQTIAGRYGLKLGMDGKDAQIEKREQKGTDSAFLEELCKDYGLVLKVYAERLWIYDREAYKKKKAAAVIDRSEIKPGSFSWQDSFSGTYTRGVWVYTNQKTGVNIHVEIGTEGRTRRIEKYASSQADAERRLRAALDTANHGARQVKFTTMGRIDLCAAQVIELSGYGRLSGLYFVDKLTHSMSGSLTTAFVCSYIGPAENSAPEGMTLNGVPLYETATEQKPIRTVTGVYYRYDRQVVSGRVRITNVASRIGKLPAAQNVTGWVNEKDAGGAG